MKSFFVIAWLMSALVCTNVCHASTNATGKVVDKYTGSTIPNVTITATMSTDVLEYKKYEKVLTNTDSKGNFVLKGLLHKYAYNVLASKKGYTSANLNLVPEKNKTRILHDPICLIKIAPINGKIVDPNGKPVSGINVGSRMHETVTKEDGVFSLPFEEGPIEIIFDSRDELPNWCKPKIYVIDTNYTVNIGTICLSCSMNKSSDRNVFVSADGRYIDNRDGTISDTMNGLVWQQGFGSFGSYESWESKASYCSGLTLGNKASWRIPAKEELESLFDRTYSPLHIHPIFFQKDLNLDFLSSTVASDDSSKTWRVCYGEGYTESYAYTVNKAGSLRCVCEGHHK